MELIGVKVGFCAVVSVMFDTAEAPEQPLASVTVTE